MSIECSECERDLRAGHDPDCSRKVGFVIEDGELADSKTKTEAA